MTRSKLTADRTELQRWAEEHDSVPVREGDHLAIVPEDEVGREQTRLDWDAFHREMGEDKVVIRHEEKSGRERFEVADRRAALDRVSIEEAEYERDEIENRLLEGETITGTVTETTVITETIVEEATLESEVIDSEVVDRRVVDAELLDRTCHSCNIVDESGGADASTWQDTDRFLVADNEAVTGEIERYEEFPFDITVEVDEEWAVTIEEREQYTVETRVTDVDVSDTETVDAHDVETDIDVESIHDHLLRGDIVDVEVGEDTIIDTETYDIETEFEKDEAILTSLTGQRTIDREVEERRRLTAEVVEGELLSRNSGADTIRESRLAERDSAMGAGETAGTDTETDRARDVDETEGDRRMNPDESDVGKPVVVPSGERIGMVSGVEDDVAYVDPHPGLTEKISAKLGWGGVDDEDFPLDESRIQRITDDAIEVSGEYDEAELENIESPK